ncbi:MAG TPA: hypothetical protein VLS88_17655 [Polyangiales bacterium]|nr:hypothetical protein [Polyangiales bacterium]
MNDQLDTLYRSEALWVQRCHCGVFHVHIGPTTLRFDQSGFEDFLSGLGQAMSRAAMWRFLSNESQTLGTA